MIYLLDVNVLIALADADHPHAVAALGFFRDHAVNEGWATCPLTENAFLRIFGNPRYPNGPGSPEEARTVLRSLLAAPGHRFWPDDLSLSDGKRLPVLPSPQQLTDCYLLALAAAKKAKLATFDGRIDASMVRGGKDAILILDHNS